jgi:hypothetical protein
MARNLQFEQLLLDMSELHQKKNHDYAKDSNPYSNFEEAAIVAGCSVDTVFRVLIGIKLSRLNELLASGKTAQNESVQDSRMDLTMYCALWTSYHIQLTYDDKQLLYGKDIKETSKCGS